MRRWLPERRPPEEAFETANDYTVELRVPSDNPNILKTLGEAGLFHVKGGNLIAISHFDHDPSVLSEDEFVMGGDRLVYAGQIDEILELKETHRLVVSDHPIRSMNEIIMDMMVGEGMPRDMAEDMVGSMEPGDVKMWVITNEKGING